MGLLQNCKCIVEMVRDPLDGRDRAISSRVQSAGSERDTVRRLVQVRLLADWCPIRSMDKINGSLQLGMLSKLQQRKR